MEAATAKWVWSLPRSQLPPDHNDYRPWQKLADRTSHAQVYTHTYIGGVLLTFCWVVVANPPYFYPDQCVWYWYHPPHVRAVITRFECLSLHARGTFGFCTIPSTCMQPSISCMYVSMYVMVKENTTRRPRYNCPLAVSGTWGNDASVSVREQTHAISAP
jgi:hypothetical protein